MTRSVPTRLGLGALLIAFGCDDVFVLGDEKMPDDSDVGEPIGGAGGSSTGDAGAAAGNEDETPAQPVGPDAADPEEPDPEQPTVECSPGAFRCDDRFLYECPSTRTWELFDVCETAALCEVAPPGCKACEPGTFRCRASVDLPLSLPAQLEQCTSDYEWQLLYACKSEELCESALELVEIDRSLASQACRPCSPGSIRCNGADLQMCSATGDWTLREACASPALCDSGDTSSSVEGPVGTCYDPACGSGEYACLGQVLQRCNADRTGFDDIQDCSAEGLRCRVETGDMSSGSCVPP